jgi:hypothetical protein
MARSTSRGFRAGRHRHLRAEVKAVCKECGRPFGWISADTFLGYTSTGGRWDAQIRWISNESGVPTATYSGGRWDEQSRGRWGSADRGGGEYQARHRLRCPCRATQVYTEATLLAKIEAAKAAGRRTVPL